MGAARPIVPVEVGLPGSRGRDTSRPYAGLPASIHARRRSTCSFGHPPSHGMLPSATVPRIASAWLLTSSYDHRSKAHSIASRSPSRNIGLMSASKLSSSDGEDMRAPFGTGRAAGRQRAVSSLRYARVLSLDNPGDGQGHEDRRHVVRVVP